MGLTQGLLATLVADTAPAELRGTAYGMFNLVTGIALLAASVIAGALWDRVGPDWTFIAGASFAGVTVMAHPDARTPWLAAAASDLRRQGGFAVPARNMLRRMPK